MHLNSVLLSLLLTGVSHGQKMEMFSEPRTGIKFVSLVRGAFNFGLSLPKQPGGNDFIGHLAGSKSMGWVGTATGPGMIGPLLLVAWPNGKDVLSSIRKAPNKRGSPPVYKGDAQMITIPAGSYVSDNGFSYTFLCKNCLSDPSLSFAPTANSSKFAYAASPQPVGKPGNTSTPLTMHTIGMGGFMINFESARFDNYTAWAALATGGPAYTAAGAGSAPAAAPAAPAAAAASPAAPSAEAAVTPPAVAKRQFADFAGFVSAFSAAGVSNNANATAAAAEPEATPAVEKRHGPDYANLVNQINSANATVAKATAAPAVAKRHGPDYANLVNQINSANASVASSTAKVSS